MFLLLAPALADETLGDRVQRDFRDRSYVLIESPSSPPRLLLLDAGTAFEGKAKTEPATGTDTQQSAIDRALVRLTDPDPAVREDAVLELADAGGGADLVASVLTDSSRDVRDTAAAVLEDLHDLARD